MLQIPVGFVLSSRFILSVRGSMNSSRRISPQVQRFSLPFLILRSLQDYGRNTAKSKDQFLADGFLLVLRPAADEEEYRDDGEQVDTRE